MAAIYELNALRHPLKALGLALRRRLLHWDRTATNPVTGDFATGSIPVQLQAFEAGEVLPWKGVKFKVAKVCGGDFPAVILVPAGATHGQKLRVMRRFVEKAREAKRVS